ncbi:hypothetical protein [Mesotoga prima]|uniref:hypothetical protein n=1 Tax=Mesotoga prima TaxID=1184387 RepID=UPI0002C9AB01|nr:hypothetical protein PHOSAC3_90652 [Mesotoga infera]
MEVKKPKWFDSWIEIDESYLKVAGTSWRLKANAPKKSEERISETFEANYWK